MAKSVILSVQRWGRSLVVRIPAAVARVARFGVGVPVELLVQGSGVLVRLLCPPVLTLEQKLARFDPQRHGGDAMPVDPAGVERW